MNNSEKNRFFKDFDQVKFNSGDRKKVFEKIRASKEKKFSFFRFSPVVLSSFIGVVTVVLLLVILSFPNESIKEEQHSFNSSSMEKIQTGLILVTNENFRAPLNIIYSYQPNTESLTVLSIPRDLNVPIFNAEGKKIGLDKMMHAYAFGGQNGVEQTILKYFGVTCDSFSTLSEDEFIIYIDQIGGVSLGVDKELVGEEVLTSLTVRKQLTKNEEKEHYELLSAVLEAALEQPKELNILKGVPEEVEVNTINIAEKVKAERIDGIFYYILGEEDLKKIRNSLNQ